MIKLLSNDVEGNHPTHKILYKNKEIVSLPLTTDKTFYVVLELDALTKVRDHSLTVKIGGERVNLDQTIVKEMIKEIPGEENQRKKQEITIKCKLTDSMVDNFKNRFSNKIIDDQGYLLPLDVEIENTDNVTGEVVIFTHYLNPEASIEGYQFIRVSVPFDKYRSDMDIYIGSKDDSIAVSETKSIPSTIQHTIDLPLFGHFEPGPHTLFVNMKDRFSLVQRSQLKLLVSTSNRQFSEMKSKNKNGYVNTISIKEFSKLTTAIGDVLFVVDTEDVDLSNPKVTEKTAFLGSVEITDNMKINNDILPIELTSSIPAADRYKYIVIRMNHSHNFEDFIIDSSLIENFDAVEAVVRPMIAPQPGHFEIPKPIPVPTPSNQVVPDIVNPTPDEISMPFLDLPPPTPSFRLVNDFDQDIHHIPANTSLPVKFKANGVLSEYDTISQLFDSSSGSNMAITIGSISKKVDYNIVNGPYHDIEIDMIIRTNGSDSVENVGFVLSSDDKKVGAINVPPFRIEVYTGTKAHPLEPSTPSKVPPRHKT